MAASPSFRAESNEQGVADALSHAVPLPAGMTAGDTMIFHSYWRTPVGAETPPAGWTVLQAQTGDAEKLYSIYTKVYNGVETTVTVSIDTSAQSHYGQVLAFYDPDGSGIEFTLAGTPSSYSGVAGFPCNAGTAPSATDGHLYLVAAKFSTFASVPTAPAGFTAKTGGFYYTSAGTRGAIAAWYKLNGGATGIASAALATDQNENGFGATIAIHVAPSGPTEVPANTVSPAVTGTAKVGETLTCDDGTWDPEEDSVVKQWYLSNVAIEDETDDTYDISGVSIGDVIKCGVIATNVIGDSDEEFSNLKTIVDVTTLAEIVTGIDNTAWTVTIQPAKYYRGGTLYAPIVYTAERLSPLSVAVHRSANTGTQLVSLCAAYDASL